MFLEKRPSTGEIILRAFFDAEVPADCLTWRYFRPTLDHGIRDTLARLRELGFDYWSLETMSIPLVDGRGVYPVPANVMALFNLTIGSDADTVGDGKALFPVTQAEYESIPDKLLCGTPTVFSFNGLSGAELAMWPVPQGFDSGSSITCNALTCVPYPYRWENWPRYWLENFYGALSAGLAYNIRLRWPPSCVPVNYLERNAEYAYQLLRFEE
jgi:hypothetical protein